jgi:signal transduction histidine kinase
MTRARTALVGVLAAGLLSLAAIMWSQASLRRARLEHLERDNQVVTHQLSNRLHVGLQTHEVALHQMASFFENSNQVTEAEFHEYASDTIEQTPLCLRLSVIEPSMKVRWVFPPEHAREVVGYDVRSHPEAFEALQRAIATESTALSGPLKLVGGAPGFVLVSPVFKQGRFEGAVVCSFRNSDFFSHVLLPEMSERYEEEVSDGGARLLSTIRTGSKGLVEPSRAEFTLGGRTWLVRVVPRQEVSLDHLQSGQTAFWTMGILLTLAAACAGGIGAVWLSQTMSRLRTQGTALEETQQRLDGAMQQLLQAEKLSALGELVASVAHEVNNPLAAILGYTQLALSASPSPVVRKRLEIVVSESERAARIVRNLLTFARKHPPEKKYLGLNDIVQKTLELKDYHLRVSQIQIEQDLMPDLPKTMLDFHQIQQVLLNLLNNAEHAILEVGRGGSIRIGTSRTDGTIELRVTDTGPGIPAEIRQRIFEPFFTTKREGKGTGLGLSLCYGIVAEHGGAISVHSPPGEGASFIVQLPILSGCGEGDTGQGDAVGSRRGSACVRVFVVDDEPNVQSFLVDLLGARGCKVDTAGNIAEAVEMIRNNSYDIIISDMKMPDGNGKDIYEAVAKKDPGLARRIVFVTGDGASQATLSFFKETGNRILSKPFRIEAIEEAISQAARV